MNRMISTDRVLDEYLFLHIKVLHSAAQKFVPTQTIKQINIVLLYSTLLVL